MCCPESLGCCQTPVVESHCIKGLPATTFSSVTGGVSADGGAEDSPSSSGVTLALGRGFMVDRCQRRSLTDGAALALGTWAVCDFG